jgi:hypothetical protein
MSGLPLCGDIDLSLDPAGDAGLLYVAIFPEISGTVEQYELLSGPFTSICALGILLISFESGL